MKKRYCRTCHCDRKNFEDESGCLTMFEVREAIEKVEKSLIESPGRLRAFEELEEELGL